MRHTELSLAAVSSSERKSFLSYLLMADSSREAVEGYLFEGEMFSVLYEEKMAGVILFVFPEKGAVEIKNVALSPVFRGRGIGKALLHHSMKHYRNKGYDRMTVGTANSSLDNIAYYQKAGFRMVSVKKDFFSEYPEPVYENGIRALDMLMFEKEL